MNERDSKSWSSGDRELLRLALSPAPECLSLGELEALLAAGTREMQSARTHAESCARCQAELALLRTFEEAAPAADEKSAAWIAARLDARRQGLLARLQARVAGLLERLAPTPALRLATIAALLVMAASAVVWQWRSNREPELRAGVVRGPEVYRSESFRLLAPVADQPSPPASFRWQPVAAADKYSLQLMEVDHSPVWSAETADNSLPIPAALRSKMLPAKTFLWQVTALDRTGRKIAESPVEQFRVVASP